MKSSVVALAVLGGSSAVACAQSDPATERGAGIGVAQQIMCMGSAKFSIACTPAPWPESASPRSSIVFRAEPMRPIEGTAADSGGMRFYNSDRWFVRDGASGAPFDRSVASRAWGISLGVGLGPFSIRAAHQNRHVTRVRLYDVAGNSMEAMNSIIAANLRLGRATAYAAYSVNRGWGSSPLFNPDNPYGATASGLRSTDSRDVLVGMAVPLSRATTFLASVMHKDDRDLANRDANLLAIGATYVVSRHTDFYASWSRMRNTSNAGRAVDMSSVPGATKSAFSIGMRHSF